MKKLSLTLLGILASTQIAQSSPEAFSGFYLGAKLGWTQRDDNTKFDALNIESARPPLLGGGIYKFEQNGISKSSKANGLNYGIYAGYGKITCGFYWGGEFSVEHDTINKDSTYNNFDLKRTRPGNPTVERGGRLYTKYERGVVFGLTPRVGAVFANENLVYLKFGIEYSQDKLTSLFRTTRDGEPVGDNPGTKVSRKNQFVFVPGIGYERAFGKILARIEYGYNFGAKIQSPAFMKEAWNDNRHCRATVKYSAHILKFGLAYKF